MINRIKKFTIQCNFSGKSLPFTIYIGNPKNNIHPIYHQNAWLTKERGGSIPTKIKESLQKLYNLSQTNGIPFPDLCAYAVTIVNSNKKKLITKNRSSPS